MLRMKSWNKSKLKVGIIGCGTIGSAIAKTLEQKFPRQISRLYLCDHHSLKVSQLKSKLRSRTLEASWEGLIQQCDLIIEAASTDVAEKVAKKILKTKNKRALIMSVGGLLRSARLLNQIQSNRSRIWIPSGAIAGMDGLAAAKEGNIRRVRLITRKPPKGLKEAPYFKNHKFPILKGNKEYRLFGGDAAQAVQAFPQNINVAAVLSLAGIGSKKTEVEIWTSRAYQRNRHEVLVEGDFGSLRSITENVPSPENPKTSYLAILSACAALRQIFASL